MWERRKGTLRNFRCHVGHAFSVESLLDEQAEEIEQMLWTALRTLKDRARIIRQLADEARDKNELVRVQQFEEEAQQALQRAELIRQAILMQEKE
jgi:two-component system chemotaxis response regulator CheB